MHAPALLLTCCVTLFQSLPPLCLRLICCETTGLDSMTSETNSSSNSLWFSLPRKWTGKVYLWPEQNIRNWWTLPNTAERKSGNKILYEICLGRTPQMFLLWETKAIGYDYLICHWASWAALAKLKIPITLAQGPFPTKLSHCWIIVKLKSKRGNILQSRVGPWSYTITITDTDFPSNTGCPRAVPLSPHILCAILSASFASGTVVP